MNRNLGYAVGEINGMPYDSGVVSSGQVDPMAHEREWVSPYNFCQNNPINRVDPTGALDMPPSTDVEKNKDGSYTVVGAKNDGDNNIYVRGADGKRTGETIGTTMQPYDFMLTNDQDGSFTGHANVTFSLDNLTVSGTVKPNDYTTSTINGADAQRLLDWGQQLFRSEVTRQSPATFYGELEILREMSRNYEANNSGGGRGALDFVSCPRLCRINGRNSIGNWFENRQ